MTGLQFSLQLRPLLTYSTSEVAAMANAKACPMCQIINPPEARLCDCGHNFEKWELQGGPQICNLCRVQAETRQVAFHQHICVFVMAIHRRLDAPLCKRCLHRQFWGMTGTTFLLGWWGLISMFVAPFVLLHNIVIYIDCLGMNSPRPDAVQWEVHPKRTPRLPSKQLVGEKCIMCEQRIATDLDGRFCKACRSPRHDVCVRRGEASGCPECGAPSSI